MSLPAPDSRISEKPLNARPPSAECEARHLPAARGGSLTPRAGLRGLGAGHSLARSLLARGKPWMFDRIIRFRGNSDLTGCGLLFFFRCIVSTLLFLLLWDFVLFIYLFIYIQFEVRQCFKKMLSDE